MTILTKKQVEELKKLAPNIVKHLGEKLGEDDWYIHFWGSMEYLCETALALHDKLQKAEAERDNAETAFESRCDLLARREAGLAEAKPFMDAVRGRHNGYSNPEMFAEPKNPKAALDQLIGEATALGLAESRLWKQELAELRDAVAAVRKSDCGAWLKDCATVSFVCDQGREKRTELMKLLDVLYKAGGENAETKSKTD